VINRLNIVQALQPMKGGTTHPWEVLTVNKGSLDSFILKGFDTLHVNQHDAVLRECMCNRLATQFDLRVPEIAILSADRRLLDSSPKDFQSIYSKDPGRPKFGSQLLPPEFKSFDLNSHLSHLEHYDIATIYGFDCLILNFDRNERKPNLLINKDQIALIDHELSLETTTSAFRSLIKDDDWRYPYQDHLFYKYLIELPDTDKDTCFDTFNQYLCEARFEKLTQLKPVLIEAGFDVDRFDGYIDYFNLVQQKNSKFVQRLKDSIR
jgi:hypothetical protein